MPAGAEDVSSQRLCLQPLAALDTHRSVYQAVYGSRAVMRLVDEAVPHTRMQASFDASLDASAAPGRMPSRWCLFDRASGRGVGLAGTSHDVGTEQVELGVLFLPDAQGRGYAGEALSVLMEVFAQRARIARFWGRHHPDNQPMARVFERLDFTRAGVLGGLRVWRRSACPATR